jgi:hypothetical protein
MKSRQLANVLIKILGLSICLYAIPMCVAGIASIFLSRSMTQAEATGITIGDAIGTGVQALFGLLVIAKSQKIAGWMFNEDEWLAT